jgi:exportin-7
VIYGAHALKLGAVSDVYGMKCKGIWICLTILMHALAGNYVNFGVFELYGDRALADALEVALKMALSIPQTDIMAYRKVLTPHPLPPPPCDLHSCDGRFHCRLILNSHKTNR